MADLEIVDDQDVVIGTASREDIHRLGQLHREVGVYFLTPNQELIFQHRAQDKDLFPDLLDATVGGHVEIGQSYEEAALTEAQEETGLSLNPRDLILIEKHLGFLADQATGKNNRCFSTNYLYLYSGSINDLKVEVGKSLGFEVWPLDKLLNSTAAEQARFIPFIFNFVTAKIIPFIKNKFK